MNQSRQTQGLGRRRLLGALGLAAIGVLPVAGCGGGEPDYWTLTESPGLALAGAPLSVEVRTPSVAAYLERDYIVRSDSHGRLKLAEDAAWASPLADMIGRTLALDLGQRLPGSNVHLQSGAISVEALVIVELDIARFLVDEEGRARLTGTMTVHRPGGGPAASQNIALGKDIDDGTTKALVMALSALVGQLADAAADAVRRLPVMASATAGLLAR